MTFLVSDTSVLIDLERGNFLDSCFRLPFQFAVPDLLYKRELADFGGPQLVARGLRVEELTKDELTVVQQVREGRPKLSLPDAYAYSLASGRGWTLLNDFNRSLVKRTRMCSRNFHRAMIRNSC